MDADLAARAADQDRRPTGAPCPLCRLPDGRGRVAAVGVCWHRRSDQQPARAAGRSCHRMNRTVAISFVGSAGDSTSATCERPDCTSSRLLHAAGAHCGLNAGHQACDAGDLSLDRRLRRRHHHQTGRKWGIPFLQIVLHAGMHKTGTTSFQQLLRRFRDRFVSQGIAVFPSDPRILSNFQRCFAPNSLRDELEVLARSGFHTAVFSHEVLSWCRVADLVKLVELFRPHPVRYVLSVRHWRGFLLSRWKQNCSRRDAQSFGSFLAELCRHPEGCVEVFFDLPVRRAIEAGISDIHVISYDLEQSRNSLLSAIAEACALPTHSYSEWHRQFRLNASNSVMGSDLVRLFNAIVSADTGRQSNPLAGVSRTGMAPDCFYDLVQIVVGFRESHPGPANRLDALLSGARAAVGLNSAVVRDWEATVTPTLSRFVKGNEGEPLFPDVPVQPIMCSSIESGDLAQGMKQLMLDFVRAKRPELFGGVPL